MDKTLLLVKLAMLIGAKKLTTADDAFALRQVHSAMDAAHHVLASHIFGRIILFDAAPIPFEKAESNPESQSEKYQFNHCPTRRGTPDIKLWTWKWSG